VKSVVIVPVTKATRILKSPNALMANRSPKITIICTQFAKTVTLANLVMTVAMVAHLSVGMRMVTLTYTSSRHVIAQSAAVKECHARQDPEKTLA